MTIFDTHAHYDDSRFDGDRDTLLSELPQRGVCNVINIGCDVHSSQLSLDMADRYGHVYAAVGIHPQQSGEAEAGDIDRLRQLARHRNGLSDARHPQRRRDDVLSLLRVHLGDAVRHAFHQIARHVDVGRKRFTQTDGSVGNLVERHRKALGGGRGAHVKHLI